MKIYLVRHGETIGNVQKIFQGHSPGELTEKGIAQAKKVSERLKDQEFSHIYSSDLKRTMDTAAEIVKYHSETPFESSEQIRERDYGIYQEMKKDEVPLDFFKDVYDRPENGESTEDLYRRAEAFYKDLFDKHFGENVLIVGHGGINRALIGAIKQTPKIEDMFLNGLNNTGVCIYEVDKNGQHIEVLYNCTKHLD